MDKITDHIQGKTIDMALTDGKCLILRTTDSHEYRIEFDKGPYLRSVNVRVVLPTPNAGLGAVFGH